jgi:hypothetical protein
MFVTAFAAPAVVETARKAAETLETAGCPYLVIVAVDGVVKHFAGPDRQAALGLITTLKAGHLDDVAGILASHGQYTNTVVDE